MSIKKNIAANYFGQFYVAIIGILLVPVYVSYMGAEAYGLVGFYVTLQAWFMLLDMGFTPTMARETSRYVGGALSDIELRNILRTLEGIFAVIAVLGTGLMLFATNSIATQWLRVNDLSIAKVVESLILISLIISLRWMSGLYRGVIKGFEQIVWLNGFNVAISTVRFVFVVPVLVYIGTAPTIFFGYQLLVSVAEIILLLLKGYALLPRVETTAINWDWKHLRGTIRFSLSHAFAGMVWVIATQTDKLIISGLISLSDFAYFTLAVLVASGVMIVTRPISGAILTRMTILHAEEDQVKLISLYRGATQMVAVISIPLVLIMSVFPQQVLFVWTGDYELASKVSSILALYAVGNGVMVLAAFPYLLQYAKGELGLHLIGNAIFVILFIPALYFLVKAYGMQGAGYAWITSNVLFFLLYVPIVHNKFAKGMHLKWLTFDIGTVAVPPLCFILITVMWVQVPSDRVGLAIFIFAVLIGTLFFSLIGAEKFRKFIKSRYFPRSQKV